jgi:DNA-binding PadR family transcriptional regulator
MSRTNLLESARYRDEGRDAWAPAGPRTVEGTGLPFLFVAQLVCKIFFHTGPQRLADLAARAKLLSGVLEPVIDFLRRERLVEVTSSSTGMNLVFALTDLGRERAGEYLRMCQYVGPAPVSLEAYLAQVRRQTIVDLTVTREAMREAFSGIIIREAILDQFGAAMNSGRAIFVYGPAGSGKTFVAEKLARLLKGDVHVPYAILVESQVIQVFDPISHERVETLIPDTVLLAQGKTGDPRWVLCRRPVVVAGGELTLDMLDLRFDEGTRFYAAPPQLKANNGLFIIDDLGRQLAQAKDLMNRWIVPLDRRVDFLALHTGEKFMVPFDVTVVFCTNLSPVQISDEAFLRRLGYKISLGPLDAVQYRVVCKQVCQSFGLPYTDKAIDYLLARFGREGRPLLACTPRDLLGQVRDQARYRGVPPELSRDLLDWAWDNYFVSENPDAIN